MERPAQVMSSETFDAVLALLPDDAVVMFSGLGDALTNRHLEGFVRALRDRGISPCVITNGLLLTPNRQASLIEAGIDQIQVSYHATSREAYDGIVVRGGDMDRLHENLAHLSRTRPPNVRARLNFVETPENAREREAARRYAESLGFDFFFRRLHSRGGSILSRRGPSACAGCGIFAAVTFITAQGDVLSCINDVSGTSRLGNVRELAWDDVVRWKRDVIARDRWFPACRGCDDDYRWVILKNGSVDLPDEGTPRCER
jgi:MoaA/NifB/PqqE/SkfB family radical SAM enzyme